MRGQRGVPGWSEHRRVAIDPYWLVVQQDSSVAANALADGGVDGRRSKWSVKKWPWRRTAARPIAAAADDATRRRPPQDVCRPRCRRTWWSGGCGPRDALGKSPLLEQNFARFRLRFRQDLGRRSEDRRRQSVFETPGGLAKRRACKSPTRRVGRALMASARGAVSAPLQLAAARVARTGARPSVVGLGRGPRTRTRTRASDADFPDADLGRGLRTELGPGTRTRTADPRTRGTFGRTDADSDRGLGRGLRTRGLGRADGPRTSGRGTPGATDFRDADFGRGASDRPDADLDVDFGRGLGREDFGRGRRAADFRTTSDGLGRRPRLDSSCSSEWCSHLSRHTPPYVSTLTQRSAGQQSLKIFRALWLRWFR